MPIFELKEKLQFSFAECKVLHVLVENNCSYTLYLRACFHSLFEIFA